LFSSSKTFIPRRNATNEKYCFTKIQDTASKVALIESISQIATGSNFEYESKAVPEIVRKPVYQLEIVALYQKSEPEEKEVDDSDTLIAD
jgi:hypothetical protein